MNKKNIVIGNVEIGNDCRPVTIAEAAVEHLGSVKVALRMIDSAKEVGADFVKFQLHLPKNEMVPDVINFWGGSLDEILENYNLSINDHKILMDYCQEIGIEYLCTPFCPDAVDVLDDLEVKGFKTGSGEMLNFPMMKKIVDTGKPVIVSTGMSTIEEIESIVNYLKNAKSEFMIMNCTSIYPAPYDSINLNLIPFYRDKFDVLVGHSDHTPDIWTSLGAVALGANVIEKHFTLNRTLNGPDSEVSLEPNEFNLMVDSIGKIHASLGIEKKIHSKENQVRDWAHHSVVAMEDISINTIVTKNMVSVKRPGWGIPARNLEDVIGKKTVKNLKKDSILQWSDFSA